jgi:DNA-binding MarR family transcriptional regulator
MEQNPPIDPEIFEAWYRIHKKMNLMEKTPCNFGLDYPLFLSEIHTIQAIGNTPENNVRIIADILGVTPSAASQVIKKLTERGLVRKIRGVRNEREVSIELTEQGLIAFINHEQTHARIQERIGYINEKERAAIIRVLSAFESVYDERIGELTRGKTSWQGGDPLGPSR